MVKGQGRTCRVKYTNLSPHCFTSLYTTVAVAVSLCVEGGWSNSGSSVVALAALWVYVTISESSSSVKCSATVQNVAARLVFELRGCEHVTPSLIQLHWLPVRRRIYFKLCTIMHAVHTGRCPAYLQEIIHTASSTTARPGLRSAVSTVYVVPRLRTKFGERAYAGPVAWNYLPVHVREEMDFYRLKDFSRLTLLV